MPIDSLVLKITLAPALIGVASLAGRRWGQSVGGWFVGLPLTSGPIVFFLALDYGTSFAADAALGSLGGAMAEAGFCLAYGWLAFRVRWAAALAAACVAFAMGAAAMQQIVVPLPALAVAAFASLVLALRAMPKGSAVAVTVPPLRWDIPARMVVTTVLVVLLTGVAPALGPRLSGVLATFPLYAAVMTVFAHRSGSAGAVQVLRGLLLGLFAFAGFFLVLGASIERLGVGAAFAAATVGALAVQLGSFFFGVRPLRATVR